MSRPKNYKRGDAFSAKRMNDLVREAKSSREIRASGPGLNNEAMGNQVFNTGIVERRLVVAVEDFSIAAFPTDFYDKIDKVPSAKCLMLRLTPEADYQEETRSTPFRIWDPVAYFNESSTKTAGQAFWSFFNADTKRWEVGGGGCETSVIRFQIYEPYCESRMAICRVLSRICGVPGEYEIYGETEENEQGETVPSKFVEVYDKVGCFFNESNLNLSGRLGYAAFLYGRPMNEYDPWRAFEVTSLCEQQTECEAF